MNNDITFTEPKNQNGTIDYETAMNMLLKSLEKSEVFQLRKHISKVAIAATALIFIIEIFMMSHIITLSKDTAAMNENISSLQTMIMKVEQDVDAKDDEPQSPVIEPIPAEDTTIEEPITTGEALGEIEEYYKAMTDLLLRQECTEEWFVEYKSLLNRYKHVVDIPEQLFDVYPDTERITLGHCVEAEAHGGSFASKVNIANVIFNRVNDPEDWGDTINDVVNAPGQFSTNKPKITNETKLACEYAFMFPDTTKGAEYFNKGGPTDPSNAGYTWLFKDDIGHNFYQKKNKLIDSNDIEFISEDDDAVG